MAWTQRHLIIVPANLQTQANAEAIKWDPDAGGGSTFDRVGLSADGQTPITDYAASTLIDEDYIPENQGGQNALDVLNAFYATSFYLGYRITEANASNQTMTAGLVETVDLFPFRWVQVGTGALKDIALQEEGLQVVEATDGN